MPFYHDKNETQSMRHIEGRVKWYKDNVALPTLISEVTFTRSSSAYANMIHSLNELGAQGAITVVVLAMSGRSNTTTTGIHLTTIAPSSSNTRPGGSSTLGQWKRCSAWAKTTACMLSHRGSLKDVKNLTNSLGSKVFSCTVHPSNDRQLQRSIY